MLANLITTEKRPFFIEPNSCCIRNALRHVDNLDGTFDFVIFGPVVKAGWCAVLTVSLDGSRTLPYLYCDPA